MDEITYNNLKKKTRLPFGYIKNNSFEPEFDGKGYQKLESIESDIADFVRKGKCLYIGSNRPGNGKTSWSIRIGKAYFDASIDNAALRISHGEVVLPVFYINVPDYLALRKNSIGSYDMQMALRDYEYNIATAKLVIFDDISDVKASDYDNNYLYSWVNTRIENGLSCIFTSNAETVEDLLRVYEEKLIDRIFGLSTVVILKDGSRREEK